MIPSVNPSHISREEDLDHLQALHKGLLREKQYGLAMLCMSKLSCCRAIDEDRLLLSERGRRLWQASLINEQK